MIHQDAVRVRKNQIQANLASWNVGFLKIFYFLEYQENLGAQ